MLTFNTKCVNLAQLKHKLTKNNVHVMEFVIDNLGWGLLIFIVFSAIWTTIRMVKMKKAEKFVYKKPIPDPSLVVSSISGSNDFVLVRDKLYELYDLAQELLKRKDKTPFCYLVYHVMNARFSLSDDDLISQILENFRELVMDSEAVNYEKMKDMMTSGQPPEWSHIFRG